MAYYSLFCSVLGTKSDKKLDQECYSVDFHNANRVLCSRCLSSSQPKYTHYLDMIPKGLDPSQSEIQFAHKLFVSRVPSLFAPCFFVSFILFGVHRLASVFVL